MPRNSQDEAEIKAISIESAAKVCAAKWPMQERFCFCTKPPVWIKLLSVLSMR